MENFKLFCRPLYGNPNEEILYVEVFDFDPVETLSEKMKKIPEVKGVKGLGVWMKEVGSTSSSGKSKTETNFTELL